MGDHELITWGEFKKIVDAADGVTDQTPIEYIDFSWLTADNFREERVGVWIDDDGRLTIC